ncbi:universal stress protein [Comamonas flocculans]|uniref:Universal stress protein n=1 Tax=Comamonas flocculans TaxID=2597701 RepID=A0A5B8RVE3_9BURK|nr:universal stress protein [Comamonas flocculans]QEA12634.1 universal stress protein [Comamonas flocculans]
MLRILVAVDGSERALDAVRFALRLVQDGALRATLVLGHVQEEASLLELATHDADAIAQASVQAGQDLMASAVALVAAAGVPLQTEIALGSPAAALADMAETAGCALIIVGARGLGGLRGTLLGSVSQALVRDATVPVTVVKHTEPEGEEAPASERAPL